MTNIRRRTNAKNNNNKEHGYKISANTKLSKSEENPNHTQTIKRQSDFVMPFGVCVCVCRQKRRVRAKEEAKHIIIIITITTELAAGKCQCVYMVPSCISLFAASFFCLSVCVLCAFVSLLIVIYPSTSLLLQPPIFGL